MFQYWCQRFTDGVRFSVIDGVCFSIGGRFTDGIFHYWGDRLLDGVHVLSGESFSDGVRFSIMRNGS